jgi:transcriptional regulator GlxA family with amidase domain
VLHMLPNSANAGLAPNDLPACLPRADEYIRRNLAHHIELADIADAAGVSTRSLETAFRRCWRTTPVAHLRNLRLAAARRMLTHPVAGMSVTDAAFAAGVTHLGRFSQTYFRRYGELPSESLSRALAATN